LIQDTIAHAAGLLHRAEAAGKKVTPGNVAFYAVKLTRSPSKFPSPWATCSTMATKIPLRWLLGTWIGKRFTANKRPGVEDYWRWSPKALPCGMWPDSLVCPIRSVQWSGDVPPTSAQPVA